ncbi:MAG: DUF1573 domain-containing protein, partial [Bacteroidota bacterium]|nr:DUF1573 domain-containing protein [Bacteroidota bacterium]
LTASSERVAEFILTNTGSESLYILKADAPEDCDVKFSTKKIEPGQSGVIRILYNPTRKGPFSRTVDLYLSEPVDPVMLTIRGRVLDFDPLGPTSCPDFNVPASGKVVEGSAIVRVRDARTNEPIDLANVRISSPLVYDYRATNEEGRSVTQVPVGLYNIHVSKTGYTDSAREVYIGRNEGELLFLLTKIDTVPVAVIEEPDSPPITIPSDTVAFREQPGELPYDEYAPNNVVFLIDVSSSMKQSGKLPLLKLSMTNLLYLLRGVDRISIVTYATTVKILLASTPADRKDTIEHKIKSLTAHGSTEGGQGIRDAYKV